MGRERVKPQEAEGSFPKKTETKGDRSHDAAECDHQKARRWQRKRKQGKRKEKRRHKKAGTAPTPNEEEKTKVLRNN